MQTAECIRVAVAPYIACKALLDSQGIELMILLAVTMLFH